MSESSATTTVDQLQSGDRACNELNSSNPEGMIPLEAEALSLGSHAESGHEDNAYPGYPIEKCSSSECSNSKSSSSSLPDYSGVVALWKNISKEVREYWSMKGPKECQNYDGDFAASERQFKDQSRKFSINISSFECIFLVKKLLENGLFTPLLQEVFSALYVFCLVTAHYNTVLDSVIGSMHPVD